MNDPAIKAAWYGPARCEHCGIRHLALFAALEKDDFARIDESIDELRLDRGERLYLTGDDPEYLYTVRKGALKLVHSLVDGSERIVRILTLGDVAGLEALLGWPYKHDAVVIEPVSACRIPVRTVNHLNRDSPHFHRHLMRRWQEAVTVSDDWLTELGTGSARARVARLLLRVSRHPGAEGAFFVPTREDMAAMVGTTTETVSRITADFHRRGHLENVARNRVRIDAVSLKRIAAAP